MSTMRRVISAIAMAVSISGFAASSEALRPAPLGSLVDVGGYRVHLYCTGAGSPTVIVVGGAFSFDWGLIQPRVSNFTRICTYDPSGTAWSDPSHSGQQQDTPSLCHDTVTEIRHLLKNAGVAGPYVLVGFSIGGLIARLYTHEYPDDVAGVVIVDHAFIDVPQDAPLPPPVSSRLSVDVAPVLISSSPITLGLEDDQNFSRLPQRNQDLHSWAMSLHPFRPTAETAAECDAAVRAGTENQSHPLGDRPLIVIRTSENLPAYERLQTKLVSLSRNSKQILAANSSHMVIIDEPELVTVGIRDVVQAIRNRTKLK